MTSSIDQNGSVEFYRSSSKAFVLDAGNNILVVRRSPDDDFRPNAWDLPGGSMDEGEQALDCVVRELGEETGLWLSETRFSFIGRSLMRSSHGNHINIRSFFVAQLGRFHPNILQDSTETAGFKWMSPDEAKIKLGHPVQRQAINWLIGSIALP